MPKLSRRKLIVVAAAAPLAGGAAPMKSAPASASRPQRAQATDPIIAKAREWRAAKAAQEAMLLEWQDLEAALCERIRPLPINLAQATRSGLPEARAMRVLMRRIRACDRKLEREARRIVLMRPSGPAAALAKIELGLAIQGPYDWEEYAYALVRDGCEQLARYL